MNDLINFEFEHEQVRVVLIVDNPWWVATDVARVLGYRDAPNMVRILDDDEKATHIVSTLGGDQELNVISESGLFAAVLKSRKPEAKRFRRWVTGVVLPTLRRTGRYELAGYQPPEPLSIDDLDANVLQARLALIRTGRALFGVKHARAIWTELGLPGPIVAAKVEHDDPLAPKLAAFLAGRPDVTIGEAAAAVGLTVTEFDRANSNRVGGLLRLLGWGFDKRARRPGGPPERLYRPMADLLAEGRTDA